MFIYHWSVARLVKREYKNCQVSDGQNFEPNKKV